MDYFGVKEWIQWLLRVYNIQLRRKRMYEKQLSMTKAYRWKPHEYITKNHQRRGKTFFSNNKNQQESRKTPDLFRKTDYHSNTRFLKDLVLENTTAKNEESSIKKRRGSTIKKHMIKFQKSPYLSKSSEIQKMLRLLVPVKGPNQSLKLQIKRHNQLNIRNAQHLIVKRTETFVDRMKAYSARMGLREETKIFMMNSRDTHIKTALLNRGWVQSGDKDSVLFHLKWVYKDRPQDYEHLQYGQLYNHYKNNQELTNKNQLQKNIKKAIIQKQPYFPLTFDLQLNQDNQSFQQNYMKFQQFRVISVLYKLLQGSCKQNLQKWQRSHVFQKNIKKAASLSQNTLCLDYLLYNKPVETLKPNKQLWQSLMNLYETLCLVVDYISREKNIRYCLFKQKIPAKDKLKFYQKLQIDLKSKFNQMLQNLSLFYLSQIFKIYFYIYQLIGKNYGFHNVWILKPAAVARGSGITITNDISKINQLKYGKILQKYIQHPLILSCKRKFDIRQWVLVKSFSPLKVYAFKKCYGRFSSYKYSNQNYENMNKHLTNYSQNKEYFVRQRNHTKDLHAKCEGGLNSVMQQSQLKKEISQWQRVKEEIYLNILKTIQCCKTQVDHKQECFEVYGFDIILDENCKPYILEVNMSPACEKRQFLEEYLAQMAEGVVDFLEGGEPKNWISISFEEYKIKEDFKEIIAQKTQKVLFLQRWWRKMRKS